MIPHLGSGSIVVRCGGMLTRYQYLILGAGGKGTGGPGGTGSCGPDLADLAAENMAGIHQDDADAESAARLCAGKALNH